jgi:hypothetical protein
MLRIPSDCICDMDEELCACFINCQKTFDHVKWKKLMQILKVNCIDWCEGGFISKLYMDQSADVKLYQ